jgi:hypothetical protein
LPNTVVPLVDAPSYTITRSYPASVENAVNVNMTELAPVGEITHVQSELLAYMPAPLPSSIDPVAFGSEVVPLHSPGTLYDALNPFAVLLPSLTNHTNISPPRLDEIGAIPASWPSRPP